MGKIFENVTLIPIYEGESNMKEALFCNLTTNKKNTEHSSTCARSCFRSTFFPANKELLITRPHKMSVVPADKETDVHSCSRQAAQVRVKVKHTSKELCA